MRADPGAVHEGNKGAPALAVHGLTKRFGERDAFRDVSFEVGYGEVFGFLGPNGAGKTTTVRTLGTLIRPTSGSATVAGVPLTPENGEEIRRRIAIMPESPGGPELIAQVIFTPLVAGWSIWIGIAISVRSSDIRVAAQLGMLASFVPIAVTVLISVGAIHPTLGLTLGLGAVLLIVDTMGWRVVAPMFDRERLITGTRS
ncbi:MAG: ATP-binding cassette domain-containing protein [Streptosporangiaceae bacterium]